MTDKIAVVKYDNIPIKAVPSGVALINQKVHLGYYLENILSLNGEVSTKRLKALLLVFQTLVGESTLIEVKKAFLMYVEGKLPIEPRTNYLDIILFSKVMKAFKESRPIKKITVPEDFKENEDFLYTVQLFDYFVQENDIPKKSIWVYTYLTKTKNLTICTEEEKKIAYNKALKLLKEENKAIEASKLTLVSRYFSTLQAKSLHIKDLI